MLDPNKNPEYFNRLSQDHFPEHMGIVVTKVEQVLLELEMELRKEFFAPNGFLHAGSIVTLADTGAGYATVAHLPSDARIFTTLELKTNFMGAARDGKLKAICEAEHMGKSTQVWLVSVIDTTKDKQVALFSCTQMILY